MTKDRTPKNASEILKDFYGFIQESEEEIRSAPLDEIKAELSAEAINFARCIEKVKQMLSKIKSRHLLVKARNQRKKLLKEYLVDVANKKLLDKEELVGKITDALGVSKEEARAYCRKFEKASKQDLNSLLKDFELLDEIGEDINVGENG